MIRIFATLLLVVAFRCVSGDQIRECQATCEDRGGIAFMPIWGEEDIGCICSDYLEGYYADST